VDKTDVNVYLAYSEIKSLCQAIGRSPDDTCQPGEKELAKHILGIMDRIAGEL
jgi:hypothetical protein